MLDCVILHVPKFQNQYRSLGNYTSTQWMTVGIFALADALYRSGFQCRILHLGLENAIDIEFSINKYLKTHHCNIVALSVQFHQQLYDSLRTAEVIKKHDDSIHIVLGGMTASFFARDILNQFSCIDAIIVGEGEKPLVQLVKSWKEGRIDLNGIPNLIWRQDGIIRQNQEHYLATQKDIDALDFCNLPLLEHYQKYVEMPKIFSRLKVPAGLRWKISKILSQRSQNIFFALSVGRGCTTNCSYCGGGARAHKILSGRSNILFLSQEKVLDEMRKLKEYGYQGAYISFDPFPLSDKYYQTLFSRMRQENLNFDLSFSAWSLPSPGFLEEFGKTFRSDSYIAISPETGSEDLRKKVRGLYYSNEELLETLSIAEKNNVRTLIFFSIGLPGETRQDFEQTLALKSRIEKDFQHSKITAFSIEIEPMAPCYLNPAKYGIRLVRRNLIDFLEEQKNPAYSSMYNLGYFQENYLDKPVKDMKDYARQVLETKCKYFCNQKEICLLAKFFWKITDVIGLSNEGDIEV